MPFFIPNRTKCAICHQPIEHRFEAAELPYIDPAVSSSLSQLARTFVHRQCWKEWEYAKLYSQSAFDLAKRGNQENSALKIEFEGDELILFWIAALNSYQLQDYHLLVTVEMPLAERSAIVNFLIAAFSHPGFTEELQTDSYLFKARWVDSGIEFTLFEDMEIVDRFIVPPERHSCWLAAMKAIIRNQDVVPGLVLDLNPIMS